MMTPETFRRWRKRHGMTHEQCAEELGFKNSRQITDYENDGSEIPRYVWLATVGYDSLNKLKES